MHAESPGAWVFVLLLCAFMLVINLTLVSLWRHRHQRPPHHKPEFNFTSWQRELRWNEEAEWERLAKAVHQLPLPEPPHEPRNDRR